MKINFLVAALVLSLAPSAFSQQLIAESVTRSSEIPGILSLGPSAYAGNYAIALGWSAYAGEFGVCLGAYSNAGQEAVALGGYNNAESGATAIGYGNNATGEGSSAFGYSSYAANSYSMALGYWTGSVDDYAISLGSKNLSSSRIGETPIAGWFEDSVLFELGNGEPTSADWYRPNLSNAITTLKNGQTTLINKAWLNRDSGTSATSDPSSATTDSGGNALVVDGHTVLNGKVVITAPQGDISMGIYQ